MSQWVDRVENHEVLTKLRTLEVLLNELEDVGELTAEKTQALDRLEAIRVLISKSLETLDPILIPVQILNNLNSQLSNLESECATFKSNGNQAHLINANNHADSALTQLSNLPRIMGLEELKGIRQAATSFRRSVAQYQRYTTKERAGLKAPFDKLKKELRETEAKIDSEKERVDSTLTELQKQFSEAQERRRQEVETAHKDWQEEFDAEEKQRTEKFQSTLAAIEAGSEELLEEIESRRDRAEELVYVIANTGMVGGYQRVANRALKSATVWQVVAAASLIGLICFAVAAFLGTQTDIFSWPRFGGRAFVALAFGFLAAYAARQADRSEETEARNRRMELLLASVDPYIASLPQEERQEVKKELALKFFTALPKEASPSTDKVKGNASDLLRMALETAADLAKKQS